MITLKKYLLIGAVLCAGSATAAGAGMQAEQVCPLTDDCHEYSQTQSAEAKKIEQLFQAAMKATKTSTGKRIGVGAARELAKIAGLVGMVFIGINAPIGQWTTGGLCVSALPLVTADWLIRSKDASITSLQALNKALAEMPAEKRREIAKLATSKDFVKELSAKLLKEKDGKGMTGGVWTMKSIDLVIPLLSLILAGLYIFTNTAARDIKCIRRRGFFSTERNHDGNTICHGNRLLGLGIISLMIAALDGYLVIKDMVDGTDDNKKAKLLAEIQAKLAAK